MRIGIDARPFKYKEYSGIPKAIFEVLKRFMSDYPEHEYFLISNSEINLPCELPENWVRVVVPAISGNGTLWQMFRLTGIVKKLKLDAYWGTNFMLPSRKVKGCKYLLTVHDLAFEIMPEVVSRKTLMVLKTFCRKACKNADYIHAVSYSTANDIAEQYQIDREKIRPIYWGIDLSVNSEVAKEKLTDNLNFDFFLVLGTLEPRKNIETIIKAFDEFKKSDSENIHIVFAGKWGWKYKKFKESVDNSKYKECIHIMEFVDDCLKYELLSKAKALLFPSLFEGFGLPVLEAFKYKLIVITCKNTSIPEVAGDAALYIDSPYDFLSLKRQMDRVLSMSDADRRKINGEMEMQVVRFSWDRCARKIHETITEE